METARHIKSLYEQELIQIIHTLPVERTLQLLDFARYIQQVAHDDFLQLADENEEDVFADETLWEEQFAATQSGLKRMAERVRSEIRAGRTEAMKFTAQGDMVPG